MADDDYAYLASLSAHPKRAGDTSNFNPEFARRLAAAVRQAQAQGLPIKLESGFREPGQTGSAYDAGGNSSHTYGLAADVSGLDGPNGKVTQAWAQIAQANGLHNPYGIGDAAEFNHWQLPEQPLEKNPKLLASLQEAKATGDIHNVWSAYNAGGGPTRPGTPTPGTTINSSPMDIVLQAESGDRNIPNVHATTSSGQAQGNAQITTGTWNDFAPKAGVDLKQYPTPMDAPRDVQIKVASVIPLNRWAPSTVNAVLAKYPGIDTSKPLGQIQSAAINPSGAAPAATLGTTINTTGALPGFADKATSDDFVKNATALDKAWHGDQSGGDEQAGQSAAFNFPPARNVSPLIPPAGTGAVSPQTYGTTLAGLMTPLQWGAQPPGQMYGANAGGQPIGQQFGTQLASLQQMQQMMAMMGSPYGDAGYG